MKGGVRKKTRRTTAVVFTLSHMSTSLFNTNLVSLSPTFCHLKKMLCLTFPFWDCKGEPKWPKKFQRSKEH